MLINGGSPEDEQDPDRLALKARLYRAVVGSDMVTDGNAGEGEGVVLPLDMVINELAGMLGVFVAMHPAAQTSKARARAARQLADGIRDHADKVASRPGFTPDRTIMRGGNA